MAWQGILVGDGMLSLFPGVTLPLLRIYSHPDRLYIIEGIATVVIASACYLAIPSSYTTAWFLNASEKAIMRRRAEITEAYSGGDGQVRSHSEPPLQHSSLT